MNPSQMSFFTSLDQLIEADQGDQETKPEKIRLEVPEKVTTDPKTGRTERGYTLYLGRLDGDRNRGIIQIRAGLDRANIVSNTPTVAHLCEWIEKQGVEVEAFTHFTNDLTDIWIDLYINRATYSA